MIKHLFIILFLLCTVNVNAQIHKYEIVLFGNSIGEGQALTYKLANGHTNYKLNTKASAHVMFKEQSSQSDIDIVYNGKTLESCKLKREKNGDWQDIQIVYENGSHFFIEDGKRQRVAKPITFTTTQLFFTEPVGVKEVYVERLNIFTPLEKKEEGLYKTVIDGGDNYYRYENGVMIEYRVKKGVNIYINKV
ncbi:MAG: hypothetical protein ACI9O4_000718 [Chitinophagales bacterium]